MELFWTSKDIWGEMDRFDLHRRGLGTQIRVGSYPWVGIDETKIQDVIF